MTKDLKTIIEDILPKEYRAKLGSENQEEYLAYENGYNDCLKDIRNKIPQLVEEIVEVINNFDVTNDTMGNPVTNPLMKLEDVKRFIIKSLTGKNI